MDVELEGITKRFGQVTANKDVTVGFAGGEVHALLGENGAGKSTLMKILYGIHRPDSGRIVVDGAEVAFDSPLDAINAGLGMVHQELMLIPAFTVAENVMLGSEEVGPGGMLRTKRAAARVREAADRFGLRVDPDARVVDLPLGVRQRVEILKALYREARVLILDEPTAVLTPQETDDLFVALDNLTAQGCAVIFISHKLREVRSIASRITVIRRGEVVGCAEPTMSEVELAALTVGRPVTLRVAKGPAQAARDVLDVQDLAVSDDRGHRAVAGASLTVRAGEIVGVAGVEGNGQSELIEAVMGLRRVDEGDVRVDGECTTHTSTRRILDRGVGYVPEDRQRDGLISNLSVADNLVLDRYHLAPFASRLLRVDRAVEGHADECVAAFDIRTRWTGAEVGTLSGGNQQKVIVARELGRDLSLLVAAQPTRGVDVGAMEFIHAQIVAARDRGIAVLLVSSDLEELLALADRVVVMYRGEIVAERSPDVSPSELGLLMGGSHPEAAPRTQAVGG